MPQFNLAEAKARFSELVQKAMLGEEVIVAGVAANEAAGGSGVLREEGGLFSNWLRANDVSIVVVRPDRYVFGGADNADQLNDLIRQIAVGLSRR